MPKPKPQSSNDDTPKAAQAFADYLELGPGRSLRALAEKYVTQNRYKSSATALTIVARWSSENHWQDRLTAAISEKSEQLLMQAAEIDSDSFLKTSVQLNKEITAKVRGSTLGIRDVIQVRESVRRPAPKSGTSVSVAVSVDIRELAERVAREEGMDVNELLADAERIAAGRWGDS